MRYFTIAVLLFLCSFANAQQNLVPNPSFEDTVYCPYGTNQIDACQNWLNFGNSPDYFNACTPFVGVPNQSFGFQYAHSGVGMVGLGIYRRPNAPSGPNYREFIGIQLLTPTTIGWKYYFSFYTNFSGKLPVAIACNKMGLNLFVNSYDSCCSPPLTNKALLFTDSILKDSVLWIKLNGSFVADSAYKYLSLGNFFDDNHTDTVRIGNSPDGSYYYIDDVCVSTDSLYNELWTGIKSPFYIPIKIDIFPNPASNKLEINANEQISEVKIYDILGQILFKYTSIDKNKFITDVSHFNRGIYFVKVITKTSNTLQRILINP